ncbi:MAG: 30S ribosome-binding factor RbfA [Verrucomicrobia bacterium]|nr:30S ribosome-binding factor RbfA [Verrucomicrobiota bacterium]
MSHRRIERVSELVKQQIGEIVQQLNLAGCGFVTVTSAVVSQDLRDGRVYVSVIGTAKQQQAAIAALEEAHGHIQHELSRRVILKYTPRLKFLLDETESHAQRIEHLLDELHIEPSND